MRYRRIINNIVFPLLLFSIILFFVSFLLNRTVGTSSVEIDKWSKIFSISAPIAGFISVIYTLIIARETQDKQISQSSLNLFHIFTDERFRLIRNKAWAVKNKWYNDVGYKDSLMDNTKKFNQTYTEVEEFKANTLSEDMSAVYDLFSFYTILSQYEESVETIKQCEYFYYGWWRKFLYEFAYELKENRRISSINDLDEYRKNISYLPALMRLDKIMGFSEMDTAQEIDTSFRYIVDIHQSSTPKKDD